jgi:hypothetical protein
MEKFVLSLSSISFDTLEACTAPELLRSHKALLSANSANLHVNEKSVKAIRRL